MAHLLKDAMTEPAGRTAAQLGQDVATYLAPASLRLPPRNASQSLTPVAKTLEQL